LKGAA